MDAKINKNRLGHLLSYDWVKIIGVIVAAILVWSLIFTMTATRITGSQSYSIVNYYGMHFGDGANKYYNFAEDEFSYEVIEANVVDVLQGGDDYVSTMIETRFATGEGDLMFIGNTDNPDTQTEKKDADGNTVTDGEGNPVYEYTSYLSGFLQSGYFFNVSRLDDTATSDGYFTQMKNYLGLFYDYTETEKSYSGVSMLVADFDENSLNIQAVEERFVARVNKNKDKRYKTEDEIAQGKADEIARIKGYAAAYEAFFANLDGGLIAFTVSTVQMTEEVAYTGVYSIDLCPNEATMGGLKDFIYYYAKDEAGTEYKTAANMNALFLELDGLDGDFKYETVALVNRLVKEYAVAQSN
ncbi:MAG: hypothetical protein IJX98_03125 [Clostridia bacterium]|nr:hypothetical protein [Clostridia bacterium]